MKLTARKLLTALIVTLGVGALVAILTSIFFGGQALLNLGLALGACGWILKIISFYYDRDMASNDR